MNKYQSYKQSGVEWIGEIPEHWGLRKLTHISDYVNCGYTSTPDYVDEGVMFLSGQNVKNGKIDYTKFNYISEELHNELTKKIKPQIGDLLVVRVGGHSNIGMSCVVDTSVDFSIYVSLTLVRLKNTICSSYFFNFIFNNDRFREFCLVETKIGGGVGNLNVKDFERFQFPLPPIQEQLQIIQFLDEKTELVDKLISKKERKITLLKEQRTSLVNEVVTKGLNPNVKMKDSGVEWIGEIPEHWGLRKLTHISDYVNCGYTSTPDYVDEGVMFLSGQNVKNGKIDYTKFNYISEELHNELTKKIKPQIGDLLVVRVGGHSNIGMSCVVDTSVDFSIYVSLTLVRLKNTICSSYFFNFIFNNDRFREFCLVETKIGGGVGNLNVKDFERFQFPLPPIQEQLQIIQFLDKRTIEIDDLIQLEQNKIDLLKEYRQSLISNVVTGKIKVTTDE